MWITLDFSAKTQISGQINHAYEYISISYTHGLPLFGGMPCISTVHYRFPFCLFRYSFLSFPQRRESSPWNQQLFTFVILAFLSCHSSFPFLSFSLSLIVFPARVSSSEGWDGNPTCKAHCGRHSIARVCSDRVPINEHREFMGWEAAQPLVPCHQTNQPTRGDTTREKHLL